MYKDMSEKLAFYKEKVIQGFIDKGIYPTDERISNLINSIDLGLPYLKAQEIKAGDSFDCKSYNAMINAIYRDLALLYKLLNELSLERYVTLKAFIDTHLEELENKVEFYTAKSKQEINSTSLGTTLLFQNKNFNIKSNHAVHTIDLGKIETHEAARISCIFNASDIEADKVLFTLIDNKGKTLSTAPYNYNMNSILIPGDVTQEEYDYVIDSNQVINGMTKMSINKQISNKNKYIILGEKNKVLVKQFGEMANQQFINKPLTYDMLGFHEKSYIDFYTVGSKSISFKFSKKPINTNFSLNNYVVDNLNYVHHFFIECDAGFAFNFELNGGEVYAIKTKGLIMDNELYFPKTSDIRSFHIIEYDIGEAIQYDVKAEFINDDGNPINIENIIIKELLPMEESE